MHDPSAVCILDRVANGDKPRQQVPQFQRPFAGIARLVPFGFVELANGVFQTFAANESHGVVRSTVALCAEAVDRYDARMFEITGHLGFEQEASAAGFAVGVAAKNLLERDFTFQFFIDGDEDLTQSAAGMRAHNAESLLLRLRNLKVAVVVATFVDRLLRGDRLRHAIDVLGSCHRRRGVAQRNVAEFAADVVGRREIGQRSGRVAIVLPQLPFDRFVDPFPIVVAQLPFGRQHVGQSPAFVGHAGIHGRHQRFALDDAELPRQHAEENVSVDCLVTHRGRSLCRSAPGPRFRVVADRPYWRAVSGESTLSR